jgi:hypothetical protein
MALQGCPVTDPCIHIDVPRVVLSGICGHAEWSRRTSDKRRFESGATRRRHLQLQPASRARLPLRKLRAACQRARRDGSRRRPGAENCTQPASVRTPTVRLNLDLALSH